MLMHILLFERFVLYLDRPITLVDADVCGSTGLPVLRMPIRKILSPLRSRKTTVTGSRTQDHQLRAIGKASSRVTTKNMRHDDDSYEELIEPAVGSQKFSNFNRV